MLEELKSKIFNGLILFYSNFMQLFYYICITLYYRITVWRTLMKGSQYDLGVEVVPCPGRVAKSRGIQGIRRMLLRKGREKSEKYK